MFANEVLHDIISETKETHTQKLKRISRTLEEIRKDLDEIMKEDEST